MEEKQYCPVTGKACFSRRAASDLIRRMKQARRGNRPKTIPQRSYLCQYCRSWHLTHYRKLETCRATIRRHGASGMGDGGQCQ